MTGDGVSIEYGVRYLTGEGTTFVGEPCSEAGARASVATMNGKAWPITAEVVSREVGPWRPVDEDQK